MSSAADSSPPPPAAVSSPVGSTLTVVPSSSSSAASPLSPSGAAIIAAETAAVLQLREALNAAIDNGDAEAASRHAAALARMKSALRAAGAPIPSATPRSPAASTGAVNAFPAGGAGDRCNVVGCKSKRSKETYCDEHYAIFKPVEDPKKKKQREKEEKKKEKERIKKEKEAKKLRDKTLKENLKKNGTGGAGMMRDTEHHLLKELRETWQTSERVVYKDLPRLAKRTSVQDDKRGLLVDAGRLVGNLTPVTATTDAPPAAGVTATTTATPSSPASSPAVAGDTTAIAPLSLATNAPASPPSSGASSPRASTIAATPGSPLLPPSMNVAVTTAAPSPMPPMLERKVTISSLSPADTARAALPENKAHTDGTDGDQLGTWKAVCNVVRAVASRVEEPTKIAAVERGLEVVGAASLSDLQITLHDLFHQHIGLQSPTFSVFKVIHQAVLFPAMHQLHSKLYSQIGQMKDVRRADGWTVLVHCGEAIYVTHTRWEQSLHPLESPEHFEVQWELRMSFDRKMQDLRAVFLRIQELKFHPDVKPDRKAEIVDVLRGSGYILEA